MWAHLSFGMLPISKKNGTLANHGIPFLDLIKMPIESEDGKVQITFKHEIPSIYDDFRKGKDMFETATELGVFSTMITVNYLHDSSDDYDQRITFECYDVLSPALEALGLWQEACKEKLDFNNTNDHDANDVVQYLLRNSDDFDQDCSTKSTCTIFSFHFRV